MLSKFKIKFPSKIAINAQALEDFIIDNFGNELKRVILKQPWNESETWQLHIDGSSSKDGSWARLIMIPPIGKPLKYAIVLTFKATNNEVEY